MSQKYGIKIRLLTIFSAVILTNIFISSPVSCQFYKKIIIQSKFLCMILVYAKRIGFLLTGNILKSKWYTKLIEQYFLITYPFEHISFFQQDRKCLSTFSQMKKLIQILLNNTLLLKQFLRKENQDYLMFLFTRENNPENRRNCFIGE